MFAYVALATPVYWALAGVLEADIGLGVCATQVPGPHNAGCCLRVLLVIAIPPIGEGFGKFLAYTWGGVPTRDWSEPNSLDPCRPSRGP